MKLPIQIWITSALWALASPMASALDSDDEQLRRAVGLMQNTQWELAYSVFAEIDEVEQAAGVSEGVYGKLLFSMGLCQMELAKQSDADGRAGFYRQALQEFKRCREFIGSPDDQNAYINRSLMRMGMCYQALGQFDAAYEAYSSFLLKRNQITDVYDHGSLLLNLATCSLQRSNPVGTQTMEYLQQAVEGRERYAIDAVPIYRVVLDAYTVADGRFSAGQKQRMLAWLEELRPVEEKSVQKAYAALSHVAQQCVDAGQLKKAQELLAVLPWIPKEPEGRFDWESAEQQNSALVERTAEQYAFTQPALQRIKLLSQLLLQYPQSERTAEWVYRRSVAHFELEQIEQARADVARYKVNYPEGEHLAEIELLELSSLFDAGQYAEALALAEHGSDDTEKLHANRLYVMAGSTCFLGKYERSIELATDYLKRHADDEHAMAVRYFQAVSYARLGYSAQARSLLSGIATGELLGFAQYELAMLDFEAASYDEAQERLEKVLLSELSPALRVQVGLLLARTAAILRERDVAEALYLDALTLTRTSELPELEQEVLFYLIAFYGREKVAGEPNEEMEKCLPHYDAFFEAFADSSYATQVASVAMPALKSAGQLERGIAKLEEVLERACAASEEAGVRDAARALIWAKIEGGAKPSKLKAALRDLAPSTFTFVQWFSLIEVYIAGLEQSHLSWGKKMRYDAILRAMYAELSMRSKEVKLPGYIELALGQWYLVDGNFPELAKTHYTNAAQSELIRQKQLANLGLARSLRMSAAEPDLVRASALLEELLERNRENPKLLEKILYESIEVLSQLQSWDILTERSKEYLIERKLDYNRSRVWYLLAKSYDLRGMNEDAMANYSRVFAGYTRLLAVSAPSVERLSELTWQRNRPELGEEKADRQIAYQLAHRYLSMVKDYPEWEKKRSGVRESLAAIRANVAAWEASGEVVSVEQMLKEMRQGKR